MKCETPGAVVLLVARAGPDPEAERRPTGRSEPAPRSPARPCRAPIARTSARGDRTRGHRLPNGHRIDSLQRIATRMGECRGRADGVAHGRGEEVQVHGVFRRQALAYALGLTTATAGFGGRGRVGGSHRKQQQAFWHASAADRGRSTSRTFGAGEHRANGVTRRPSGASPARRGRTGAQGATGAAGRRRRAGGAGARGAGRLAQQRTEPERAVHDHALEPGHPAQGSAGHADDQRRGAQMNTIGGAGTP